MATHIDEEGITTYEGSFWSWALPQFALPLHLLTALGFALGWSLTHSPSSPWVWALGLATGAFGWTFFEYAVHRWLFHQTGHPVLRAIYKAVHLPHHRMMRMADPNHRTLHPLFGIAALLPAYFAAMAFGQTAYSLAAAIGFCAGYCAYELLHYVLHATQWVERFEHLPWVRQHTDAHVAHHLANPRANFGFTTYFWDKLFGTFQVSDGQSAG